MKPRHRITLLTLGLALATAVATLSAPAGATGRTQDAATTAVARCPQLRLTDQWYGSTGERLQKVIDRVGTCQGSPGRGVRPVAVFDWDNTMMKNDISDQTTFWLLRRSLLRQPAGKDWRTTSRWMTPAAAKALRRACGPLAKPGERLSTGKKDRRSVACADEILSMRLDQETTAGRPGFAGDYDHRRMNAGYAWMAQLMAGRTPAQVREIARDARRVALRARIGDTWRVGSTTQIKWTRYYRPMKDLVRTLKKAGIEPWVISASPELWADVWGPGIGVPAKHVVGIRTQVEDGRVVGHLKGCGGYADGSDQIMPFVEGKRCWVNQEIRGIQGRAALRLAPADVRPVIAAGDASTDITMVADATRAHVVLNRNGAEIMCQAYANQDGRWLVTPMFIQPLPQLPGRYPCATEGREKRDGSLGPVRGIDGRVIPDQRDAVFG
ncbi:MAG: HAD family hydrolase [Nocardioidaceae bacterium]|nr:HAD family hydrolase [Nocardioidaceae bacterium]